MNEFTIPSPILELQAGIYGQTRGVSPRSAQLMTWLLDRRNLEAAWERVRKSDGANTPGMDGVICRELATRGDDWLKALADDLYHGRYRPSEPRWVDIPKGAGKEGTRRLGILTVRDRIVHAALKLVLEPLFEPRFVPSSFGFRPGRSVAGALAEAARLLSSGTADTLPYPVAVRLDVKDCFPTIDHQILLERLATRVGDADVLRLVESLLRAGGTRVGRLWGKRWIGVVQGSALSPLLCNVYLDAFDRDLAELAKNSQQRIRHLRYADDVLLLAGTSRLLRSGLECATRSLSRLRQRPGKARSGVCKVRDGVDWLGVRLLPRPGRWTGKTTFGYVIPDEAVLRAFERVSQMTRMPSTHIDPDAFNLAPWIVSVNERLREWHQAYVFADNAAAVFSGIDAHVDNRFAQLLHSVFGVRRGELEGRYRVRLPRGFRTWQVDGARLVVLSSLAPRCPVSLTRRPAWMKTLHRNGRRKTEAKTPTQANQASQDPAVAGG